MPKKNIKSNDIRFNLLVRFDARNCRQLAIRILAAIAAIAVAASKVSVLLSAAGG